MGWWLRFVSPFQGYGPCTFSLPRAALRPPVADGALPWADLLGPLQAGEIRNSAGCPVRLGHARIGCFLAVLSTPSMHVLQREGAIRLARSAERKATIKPKSIVCHARTGSSHQCANCDQSTPAAMADPMTPATLGAMACISRKLCRVLLAARPFAPRGRNPGRPKRPRRRPAG